MEDDAMEDDASSEASGDTIDLSSPEPSPEKRLSDHMLISEAAFSPQSSGALKLLLAELGLAGPARALRTHSQRGPSEHTQSQTGPNGYLAFWQ